MAFMQEDAVKDRVVKDLTFPGSVSFLLVSALGIYVLVSHDAKFFYGIAMLAGGILLLVGSFRVAAHYHKKDVHIDICSLITGLIILLPALIAFSFMFSLWLSVGIIGAIFIYLPIGYALKDKYGVSKSTR